MKLPQAIPNWRQAWRMLSVQINALAIVWIALPDAKQSEVLSMLPGLTANEVAGLLVALGIVGRLIAQPKVQQ